MMIVTITGPRSVGKSTISKLVAKRLKLRYVSSDELGERTWKKHGGLDAVIKSGQIIALVKEKGYSLIEREYLRNNFVFDLSGGSISSKRDGLLRKSARLRRIARKQSIVVGLLPFRTEKKSVTHLFERERKRSHFLHMGTQELMAQTRKTYRKFPPIFKTFCHVIVYTEDRSAREVAEEIVRKVKD